MPKINEINEILIGTNRGLDTSGLQDFLQEISIGTKAAESTLFGDKDGEITDAFQCLVQIKDDKVDQLVTTTKPVLMTIIKELPGIETKMKTAISSADLTKLNKIFGSSLVTIGTAAETVSTAAATNMNHKIFCDASPTNVTQIIIDASGATKEEFEATTKKLLSEDLQAAMTKGIEIVQSEEVKDIMENTLAEADSLVKTKFGGLDSGSLLKDLSENFTGELGTTVGKFGDEFTPGKTLSILNAAFGGLKPIDLASSFTDIPAGIVSQAGILGIDTNITSRIDMRELIAKMEVQAPELLESLATLSTKIDTQFKALTDAKTTIASTINDSNTARHRIRNAETSVEENEFTILGSQEEIESILKTVTRNLTTIVWHWTGHYIDDGNIGSAEINREFSVIDEAIPYHFIIRRNGSIQTGAPVGKETGHVRAEFRPLSFGVAFVAGFNGAKGGPPGSVELDAASINQAQWKSFNTFMKAFYNIFPGGDAFGNNDLDIDARRLSIGSIGPGFNVSDKIIKAPFYRLNSAIPLEDKKFLTRDELIAKGKVSEDIALEEQDIQ